MYKEWELKLKKTFKKKCSVLLFIENYYASKIEEFIKKCYTYMYVAAPGVNNNSRRHDKYGYKKTQLRLHRYSFGKS